MPSPATEAPAEYKYDGFPLRFVCVSERDIDDAKAQINKIAESLAKTNKVYWRRPIEIWKDYQFETGIEYSYVTARLAFAPVEPYGIQKSTRTFDNDEMLSYFGLNIDNNRS